MSKRVIITGAASGIGEGTAAALRSRGCSVIGLDIQDGEVSVFVNWRRVGSLAPTSGWGSTQTFDVRASWLHNTSPNYLSFVASEDGSGASDWGVRDVGLTRIRVSPSPTPTPS